MSENEESNYEVIEFDEDLDLDELLDFEPLEFDFDEDDDEEEE